MKIAITSLEDNVESLVDRRFGRCNYFAIYDTGTGTCEFVKNSGGERIEGAGITAVNMIRAREVKKVVSGEFGKSVKLTFDQLQVQLISLPDQTKTISQIIGMLKQPLIDSD
jgi:predicted Fe-Mo cluster-binding NifX family protein